MTTADTEQIEQEARALVSQANEIAVRDALTFQHAALFLRNIAGYLKKVAEVFDPMVEAAHKAHTVALEQRKKMTEPAETAKRLVNAEMGKYQSAERDRVEREERAAAAERRRLEDEERLRIAASLEKQGKPAAAEQALTAPVSVRVFTPPVQPVAKAEGVSFREEWDFVVENENLIPREYLIPDEKKIRAIVRSMKDKTAIPGIKAFPKIITSTKA